jgi:hypothetical protein
MAEETENFFQDFQPADVDPEAISQSPVKKADKDAIPFLESAPASEQGDPNLIQHLKEDQFFDGFQSATPADKEAALDQNQTLIDSLLEKSEQRFFGEDVDDPFLIPRSVGIIAGSVGVPLLANQYLPPGTPPMVRGAVSFGASLFGTGMGAVSPELGMEIAESVSLIPEGTRARLGLNNAELQTVVQGELLLDAAFNTGFTVLRQVGRITGRFFTTGGKLTKEGREALELSETAAEKFGIQMLPVQIRDRKIARGFVSVFGHFPFVASKVRTRAEVVTKQVQTALKSLGPRVGPLVEFSDLSAEVMLKSQRAFKNVARKFNIQYTRLYDRAAQLGVQVIPKSTTAKARAIIETSDKAAQAFAKGGEKGFGPAGVITNRWVKFLRANIIPMEQTTMKIGEEVPLAILTESGKPFIKKLPDIPPNIARQSLQQLDGLVNKIDEFMSTLDKTNVQDRFIRKQATQLKMAIKNDLVQNIMGKNMGDARALGKQFKALDEEFSLTMSQIFETATANRFGAVKKGGLTGKGVLREATRTPVDMLAKTVVQMDSPQAMMELRNLVGKKTFKRVTAFVLDNAVEKSMKGVEGSNGALKTFNSESFIKELGIGKGTVNSRRGAIEKMLKLAEAPFSMKDLDTLVTAMKKIEGTPIPDASTFVARRAILGGLESAVGAFAVYAAAFNGDLKTTLTAASLFILGKGFSRLISKPETAQAFLKTFDDTATVAVRRGAYVKAMRLAIETVKEEDPFGNANQLMELFVKTMPDIDELLGLEGAEPIRDLLKTGKEKVIDLTKPETEQPTIDISEEVRQFGGDTTLK